MTMVGGLVGAVGASAEPVGAAGFRPEAITAVRDAVAALPMTSQRITVTASGGLKFELIELAPAEARAGARPQLATVVDACGARWSARLEVAPFVTAMINDARRASVSLCIRSAYRTFDEQVAIRLASGCANYPEPTRSACVYDWTGSEVVAAGMGRSARPGYSRHQQGLAFDIVGLVPNSAIGNWITANAHRYGFYRFGDFKQVGPNGLWGLDDPGHLSVDGG